MITVAKILIDKTEFDRLKEIESKYVTLKKNHNDLLKKVIETGADKNTGGSKKEDCNKSFGEGRRNEQQISETESNNGSELEGGDGLDPKVANFNREVNANLNQDKGPPLPAPNLVEEPETQPQPKKKKRLIIESVAKSITNAIERECLESLYVKNQKKGQLFLTRLKQNGCSWDENSGMISNMDGAILQECVPFVLQTRKSPVPDQINRFIDFLVTSNLDDDFLLNPYTVNHFDWYLI